jgi:putative tricarboxylic transport membrane protein
MMAVFGFIGYLLIKLDCEPAPLLLGFILGPMLEENLRRAMLLSRGDWGTFVERPISLTLLVIGRPRSHRGAQSRAPPQARRRLGQE